MFKRRTPFALVPLGAVVFLGACKAATEVCTDPLTCGGGTPVTVTSVTVTSPTVDTVIAVGRTAQLQAAAASGSGPVTVPFSWTSSPTAVATVSASGGLVTGVAPGNALITVSQTNNAVTGTLQMRVVDANLPAVTAAIGDTLARSLRQALGASRQSAVQSGLTTCNSHVTSGNLLALKTCLTGLTNVPSGGSAADSTLLNALDIFFVYSKAQLGL